MNPPDNSTTIIEIRNDDSTRTGTDYGGYKTCSDCGASKAIDSYHKQGRNKPRRADCDVCRRSTVRKYHASNRKESRSARVVTTEI